MSNLANIDLSNRDLRYGQFIGANLSGSQLTGSDLRNAYLIDATLSRVSASNVDLSESDLSRADMTWATLNNATMVRSDLSGVDLSGANLRNANLTDARFGWSSPTTGPANLSRADLSQANLTNANLAEANIEDTMLQIADLRGARIELAPGQRLPLFINWGSTKNLASLFISTNPHTISSFQRLRDELKLSGLRNEERGITASIKRAQTRSLRSFEDFIKYLAFDITTEWGSNPHRALVILGALILVFSLPYTAVMRISCIKCRGKIWKVWNPDRLLDREVVDQVDISYDSGAIGSTTLRDHGNGSGRREPIYEKNIFIALPMGLYFSVLSAFHFGWHELNVGNWIARIQPHEYVLRPSGWIRAVSGIQGLHGNVWVN